MQDLVGWFHDAKNAMFAKNYKLAIQRAGTVISVAQGQRNRRPTQEEKKLITPAYFIMGDAHYALGPHERAIYYWNKLKLRENAQISEETKLKFAVMLYNKGFSHRELKEGEKALECFNQAIKLNPNLQDELNAFMNSQPSSAPGKPSKKRGRGFDFFKEGGEGLDALCNAAAEKAGKKDDETPPSPGRN